MMCLKVGILNDGSKKLDGSPQPHKRRRFLVCDHVQPHRGDEYLFYFGDVQTLCPDHHDIVKQREEQRGYSSQVDESGWPVDPNHPANR
ncbi:hypothetical protein ACQU0X_14665 [Pseudovibrio ascidiaceicola]|uniref:hypothetical protein n=1 Tax=Pseudovibrio ascidiaceicola TaxID=285279 RepID=UPI003D3607E6